MVDFRRTVGFTVDTWNLWAAAARQLRSSTANRYSALNKNWRPEGRSYPIRDHAQVVGQL